jgi:hypothetical protein
MGGYGLITLELDVPWYCGLKSQPPFFGWIPNKRTGFEYKGI